jgi:phosphatidylinositol alpha-1,6-mannosyltransferase
VFGHLLRKIKLNMKTLLIALEFPPAVGGVETYYGKLEQYWPEPLKVLTNSNNALLSHSLPIFRWFKGFFSLVGLLRHESPDWVLAGEILPIGTIVYLASFIRKFKYGVFLHGLDFSLISHSTLKQTLAKLILAKANLVICANHYTASQVKNKYPALQNIEVVNPGVEIHDDEAMASGAETFEKKKEEKVFNLLSVGRLVKRKGFDLTLQALAQLEVLIPKMKYTIIGDGPDKKYLEDLIRELRLGDMVSIFSNLDDIEKNKYLESCDVFIMPSRDIAGDYEGFGIVYLEAGLFGKPVIAGKSGGVSDAVQNEVTGLLVDGEKTDEIAQAIIRLYNDESLRHALGEKGRAHSLANSWKERATTIYSLLQNR